MLMKVSREGSNVGLTKEGQQRITSLQGPEHSERVISGPERADK